MRAIFFAVLIRIKLSSISHENAQHIHSKFDAIESWTSSTCPSQSMSERAPGSTPNLAYNPQIFSLCKSHNPSNSKGVVGLATDVAVGPGQAQTHIPHAPAAGGRFAECRLDAFDEPGVGLAIAAYDPDRMLEPFDRLRLRSGYGLASYCSWVRPDSGSYAGVFGCDPARCSSSIREFVRVPCRLACACSRKERLRSRGRRRTYLRCATRSVRQRARSLHADSRRHGDSIGSG